MGDGDEAANQPPPCPPRIRNSLREPSVDSNFFNGIAHDVAHKDAQWNKLLKKKEKILALPKVTVEQRRKAWQRVVEAMWDWQYLAFLEEERKLTLHKLEVQMRARLMEIKHEAAAANIEKLKQQMGNRFRIREVNSNHFGDGRGGPAEYPPRITHALSALQKVTSPSPPKSSESPSPESESPSAKTSSCEQHSPSTP